MKGVTVKEFVVKKDAKTNIMKIVMLALVIVVGMQMYKSRSQADAKQSYQLVQEGKAIIIDVREAEEVAGGMVKDALWVPTSQFNNDPAAQTLAIKKLAGDKEIFVYCSAGGRAGRVADKLKDKGMKATNLGGFKDLEKEQIPTQSGPRKCEKADDFGCAP